MFSKLKAMMAAPAVVAIPAASAKAPGSATPTTKQAGDAAESLALAHLVQAGLRLIERNYRTPGRGGGEIDLILSGCVRFNYSKSFTCRISFYNYWFSCNRF